MSFFDTLFVHSETRFVNLLIGKRGLIITKCFLGMLWILRNDMADAGLAFFLQK